MGLLAFLDHVVNLFVPAVALAAIAAALVKWVWRRDLAAQRWWRLATPAALFNAGVTLGGLVLLGRDGRMGTYAAMVLATALTLWWQAFGPRRR